MREQSPPPLTYSTVKERHAPIALYYLAMICGIVPLVSGMICLLGYWLTQWEQFAIVGLFDLVLGGGTVLIGFIFSAIYFRLAKRATVEQSQSVKRAHKAQWILFANIPAAVLCTAGGIWLTSHPIVTFEIQNTGKTQIEAGSLSLGSRTAHFGTIPPNGKVAVKLRIIFEANAQLSIVRTSGRSIVPVSGRVGDADDFIGNIHKRVIVVDEKQAIVDY